MTFLPGRIKEIKHDTLVIALGVFVMLVTLGYHFWLWGWI